MTIAPIAIHHPRPPADALLKMGSVQCLSLALVADDDRRKGILRTANEVVLDFRGDLPNMYLPMNPKVEMSY